MPFTKTRSMGALAPTVTLTWLVSLPATVPSRLSDPFDWAMLMWSLVTVLADNTGPTVSNCKGCFNVADMLPALSALTTSTSVMPDRFKDLRSAGLRVRDHWVGFALSKVATQFLPPNLTVTNVPASAVPEINSCLAAAWALMVSMPPT